jgi:SAM-dependent methyltransferase
MRNTSVSSGKLGASHRSPTDYFGRPVSVQVNACWTLDRELETSLFWWLGWLVLRGKLWKSSAMRGQLHVHGLAQQKLGFIMWNLSSAIFPKFQTANPFDAAVGRFILMWVNDPVAVLRSAWRLVRPGGVAAFHEPYWAPALELLKPLPLWSAVATAVYETFRRSRARPELGPDLYRIFLEAGLPGPTMRLEMILGKDPELAQWFCDIVQTLLPQIQEFGLWTEELGDLKALRERLQAEVVTSRDSCHLASLRRSLVSQAERRNSGDQQHGTR